MPAAELQELCRAVQAVGSDGSAVVARAVKLAQALEQRASLAALPAGAHIQRGAVPDMYDRIAEAHDASLDEDHTGCRAILKECMRLLADATAPDQFRAAAKMMAVQPACMTCNGHGMIGGLLPNGGGYESDPCPDCTAPAPAEVPMPEPVGTRFDGTRLLKEADVRTYGAAREAAGYARGLKAGRDAERYRIALQLIEHATAPAPDDGAYHENAHELAKHALRGR